MVTHGPYLHFAVISAVLGIILLVYYHQSRSRTTELSTVHSYDASELRRMCSDNFNAIVEVQGEVSCDKPVIAPTMKVECCWCKTVIEREVRESRGRASWESVSENTLSAVFKITDGTGHVLVYPEQADIEAEKPYRIIVDNNDSILDSLAHLFSYETGRYRITEEVFLPTGYAFVLGRATNCGQGTNPDVMISYPKHGYADPNHKYFIISRKTRNQLEAEESISLKVCLWGSVAAFLFAAYCGLCALGVLPN